MKNGIVFVNFFLNCINSFLYSSAAAFEGIKLFLHQKSLLILLFDKFEFAVFFLTDCKKICLLTVKVILHGFNFIHVFRNCIVDFFNFLTNLIAFFLNTLEFFFVAGLISYKVFKSKKGEIQFAAVDFFFELAVFNCFFRLNLESIVLTLNFSHGNFNLSHVLTGAFKLAFCFGYFSL